MVLSLVSLCAREVVRDHSSSPCWLRCALQVLDLCGLQGDEGGMGDPMGGWSLTVALCTMVVQARTRAQRAQRERKRLSVLQREKDVKRERGEKTDTDELRGHDTEELDLCGTVEEDEVILGVRRRMEVERKRETLVAGPGGSRRDAEEKDENADVSVHVRADLFVNARSLERVRGAVGALGPLRLQCRYLRVEEVSVTSIKTLLGLLPRQGLLGVDVRYSSLGVAGLAELLPLLSTFPALSSLRLHYCNLDFRRDHVGQEEALRDLCQGLTQLQELRRLSLTALRLPGQLRVLLSSLPQPLEVLELPYLSLSPGDLAYLSCSHHASTLQQLDLSENRLDENTVTSVCRLLSQAASGLQHLSLTGCGLTDALLGLLLPSLGGCRALKSLALALNPLSVAGLVDLVRMAVRMPSLRQLLYPNPLEDYQPGLPDLPSSAQLLDWPLDAVTDINVTSSQLNRVLIESGRSDLFLTCDLLNYDKDLVD
ncbi:leucine-rich repeat-containing protein 14 isoform 2-T2 [Spinachia spinachia]